MDPIPYGRHTIGEDDLEAVVQVLKSDYLTQGPYVAEFEKKFAEYIGVKHALAVSNGTAALHLATMALGVAPGDKVITTPITFAASANCVRYCGGEVVFADIDPETFLLDINQVEKLLRESPKGTYKGIIPVDFAGRAVDLEAFRKLADQYGLWIIEDACHAPGGYFINTAGEKHNCGNGNYAELAIFSFHPVKHIATGEGGMITTNDDELYKKLLLLRTHGITRDPNLLKENHGPWYYEMQELGYNYRLTDFQANLGISQLRKADSGLARRMEIAEAYESAFQDMPEVEYRNFHAGHAYHLYIIKVQDRLALYTFLRENNIFCQVHYIPVHLMPYYQSLGAKPGDMPQAESYYERCLSLPMYPSLNKEQQQYVISKIKEYYHQ